MKLTKHLYTALVKPVISRRLKKQTVYKYGNLVFTIFPGVFHPRYFFSSKILASFVLQQELKNKKFCDACSGSGFTGLQAYAAGADVTCFDIDPQAVENIRYNYDQNFQRAKLPNSFSVVLSDGFASLPAQTFDIIAVNPPYFFKAVDAAAQLAWNCGNEGEFFTSFFRGLPAFMNEKGVCYMILADNCDIERIQKIANEHHLSLHLVYTKKVMWEKNYIFEIRINSGATPYNGHNASQTIQ